MVIRFSDSRRYAELVLSIYQSFQVFLKDSADPQQFICDEPFQTSWRTQWTGHRLRME